MLSNLFQSIGPSLQGQRNIMDARSEEQGALSGVGSAEDELRRAIMDRAGVTMDIPVREKLGYRRAVALGALAALAKLAGANGNQAQRGLGQGIQGFENIFNQDYQDAALEAQNKYQSQIRQGDASVQGAQISLGAAERGLDRATGALRRAEGSEDRRQSTVLAQREAEKDRALDRERFEKEIEISRQVTERVIDQGKRTTVNKLLDQLEGSMVAWAESIRQPKLLSDYTRTLVELVNSGMEVEKAAEEAARRVNEVYKDYPVYTEPEKPGRAVATEESGVAPIVTEEMLTSLMQEKQTVEDKRARLRSEITALMNQAKKAGIGVAKDISAKIQQKRSELAKADIEFQKVSTRLTEANRRFRAQSKAGGEAFSPMQGPVSFRDR